jgi:hypothetical protein
MAVEWIEIDGSAPSVPGVGPRDTPSADAADAIAARVQFISTGLNWWSINRRLRTSFAQMSPRVERALRGRDGCGVMVLVHFQEIRNEWLTQYMYIGHTEDLRVFQTPLQAVQYYSSTASFRAGAQQDNIIERMFWARLV